MHENEKIAIGNISLSYIVKIKKKHWFIPIDGTCRKCNSEYLIKNYKNTGYDKIVFKMLTIKIVTVSFSI